MEMRVILLAGFFGQRCELRTDGGQPQYLTVLGNARASEAHACTAGMELVNSWSYSIMVGSGRS
jgi:hypothetical protein